MAARALLRWYIALLRWYIALLRRYIALLRWYIALLQSCIVENMLLKLCHALSCREKR